jgi:hypothetical protein
VTGVIRGGRYARRKWPDGEQNLSQLRSMFAEMARGVEVDSSRPSLEFYRSRAELHLLVPAKEHGRARPGTRDGNGEPPSCDRPGAGPR